jgi:hypothetical protein
MPVPTVMGRITARVFVIGQGDEVTSSLTSYMPLLP